MKFSCQKSHLPEVIEKNRVEHWLKEKWFRVNDDQIKNSCLHGSSENVARGGYIGCRLAISICARSKNSCACKLSVKLERGGKKCRMLRA